MEITDLSWNKNLQNRFNNPLLPRSIRGLIVGKSGCGKTTLLLNLLLKPGWCYVPTQLFLACTCVYLFLVSPVAIFRTGFPFVEYCSGSFRPCLQSDY